jgi:hypothetical protein
MENLIAFVGIGGVIGMSIALALGLEWLSLRALMYWMPGPNRQREPQRAVSAPARRRPRGPALPLKRAVPSPVPR